MKLQTSQILQIFHRVQDHGRLTAVHISKHSCVCGVCVGVCGGVLAESLCGMCDLCFGVVCWGVVWCGLACEKPLRMQIQNASVCAFKTTPCAPGKRPHVLNMRAFSGYTRKRPERTHGGVFNTWRGFPPSLLSSLFSSLSSLLSSLFPLSNDDNDHSSSRLSLCTHGSDS